MPDVQLLAFFDEKLVRYSALKKSLNERRELMMEDLSRLDQQLAETAEQIERWEKCRNDIVTEPEDTTDVVVNPDVIVDPESTVDPGARGSRGDDDDDAEWSPDLRTVRKVLVGLRGLGGSPKQLPEMGQPMWVMMAVLMAIRGERDWTPTQVAEELFDPPKSRSKYTRDRMSFVLRKSDDKKLWESTRKHGHYRPRKELLDATKSL